MNLNKKYFLALFTAFGIQLVWGINLANAVCDNEISRAYQVNKDISPSYWFHWVTDEAKATASSSELNIDTKTLQGFRDNLFTSAKYVSVLPKDKNKSCAQLHSIIASEVISNIQSIKRGDNNGYYMGIDGDNALICVSQYLASNNCDFSALTTGGSNQRSSSSANPDTSSSQSSSTQFNSPESYNLQVSQTNKQNYQAVQRAYKQANAGKGKKHNKEANATECMKTNPAQKSFTNKCSQAINFTYCFSGVPTGAKNENPQTLADLSCQNGQFGTLTIGAGESIPGSYNGLSIQGLPCKSPSQPVDMGFDRATNAATGRCSF